MVHTGNDRLAVVQFWVKSPSPMHQKQVKPVGFYKLTSVHQNKNNKGLRVESGYDH